MIRLASLGDAGAVRHAFFTRQGGVSNGFYASLNCGWRSGDIPEHVERNRALAMRQLGLGGDRLATCRQVHGTAAVVVTVPWARAAAPEADAMASNVPGVALGVLAADCAPVLFLDPVARVVGAAHAGWRGALGGVVEAAVAAMEQLGAARERVRAGIGPCIGPSSYEVGAEFPRAFTTEDPAARRFFTPAPRAGHFLFDLPGYIAHRLSCCGIAHIESAGCDTAADAARFFSYRRARLRGEPVFGLALSAIAIEA